MDNTFTLDKQRLRNLPRGVLSHLIPAIWWVRKTFFSKPKPANPAVFVDRPLEEVIELLGRNYFEPGWEFSYSYSDEVLNLRRVEYASDVLPGCLWFQVHIRGYEHNDGRIELAAHFETEPTEHPDEHINKVGIDVDRGNGVVMELLNDLGVTYEYVEAVDSTAAP